MSRARAGNAPPGSSPPAAAPRPSPTRPTVKGVLVTVSRGKTNQEGEVRDVRFDGRRRPRPADAPGRRGPGAPEDQVVAALAADGGAAVCGGGQGGRRRGAGDRPLGTGRAGVGAQAEDGATYPLESPSSNFGILAGYGAAGGRFHLPPCHPVGRVPTTFVQKYTPRAQLKPSGAPEPASGRGETGGGGRPVRFCQEQRGVMTEQFSSMEHNAFHVPHLSDTIPRSRISWTGP